MKVAIYVLLDSASGSTTYEIMSLPEPLIKLVRLTLGSYRTKYLDALINGDLASRNVPLSLAALVAASSAFFFSLKALTSSSSSFASFFGA
jgi:hypothetical protein